jgi:UDP-4-amino-4,6-dideoxy-N-acetyl-beta-L-altrosamine transaminase
MRPIPYGRQALDEDDVAAVVSVLRGDWLTQGPAVAEFEAACADAVGAPFAVAFSSGTAALHAAASAAGLGPGDELLTSGMTFAASANCGAYVGAVPRFADIDPRTWNVTADTLSDACTDATRAVVAVHFGGLPAPIPEIRDRLGGDIALIEDASHAIGSVGADGPVGACLHSDMAVFSFHPVKTIAAGEGGLVTTRDASLRDRLADFRTHGMTKDPGRLSRDEGAWYMEQQSLGFNYRLSDIHSALGRSQLAKLDRFIEERNRVAQRYREGLADVSAIALPAAAPGGQTHAYHLFVIRVRAGREARRALYDGLRARDVLAQVHYLPVYLHPWYRETYGYAAGLCPQAEAYYDECLSLPCFVGLSEEDQDYVIGCVRDLV